MLNELATAVSSLESYNVPVEAMHPWVKRLGRSAALVLGLDRDGIVRHVEALPADVSVTLSKISESNHANFPAVNLAGPLFDLDPGLDETQSWLALPVGDPNRRASALRVLCEKAQVARSGLPQFDRLRRFCLDLQPRFPSEAGSFAAFPTLLVRLLGVSPKGEEWCRQLCDAAFTAAAQGSAALLGLVEQFLVGKFNGKKAVFEAAKVLVLFDVSDLRDFECRVADPRMSEYFSRRLLTTEREGDAVGTCSLTGKRMPLETDKLPNPLLPVLGGTYLMSMNRDTPCQTRYKRTGTNVFRIGKKTAQGLNSALLQLTGPSRQGRTWQRVPASVQGKSNLLVAYLQGAPEDDSPWAALFSESEEAAENYCAICTKVCDALGGRPTFASDRVQVFVLNKISPGQVQVELSDTFTASQIVEGGKQWVCAAGNLPPLCLDEVPGVPSPAEVMRCTQMVWIRGGKEFTFAPGYSLRGIYDLLISDSPQASISAQAILHAVLSGSGPLLAAVAHARHRKNKDAWKGFAKAAVSRASRAAAVIGIGLYRLHRTKEEYMQGPAYKLGRFLSLVDTLHHEYCQEVRGNQLPPQLLGNSLIPAATGDPKKALAQMLNRIRVYQAWAGKSGTALARWTLGEIGKLAPELAEALPERMNDLSKAELLLGYLARSEKKEQTESEEES